MPKLRTFLQRSFLVGLLGWLAAAVPEPASGACPAPPMAPDTTAGPHTGYVYNDHLWGQDRATIDRVINELWTNGVRYIHTVFDWGATEKAKGAFDYAHYDFLFCQLRIYGLRAYVEMGGGVDGWVEAMPPFHFGRNWYVNAIVGSSNKVIWTPSSNRLAFHYEPQALDQNGNGWLTIAWANPTAKAVDVRPPQRMQYSFRARRKSGQPAVHVTLDYRIMDRANDTFYIAHFSAPCAVGESDSDDSSTWPSCTIQFDPSTVSWSGYQPQQHYLALELGILARDFNVREFDLDLSSFMVKRDGIAVGADGQPLNSTNAFTYIDKERIRWSYDQFTGRTKPAVDRNHYLVVQSDPFFRNTEEAWMRDAITWVEQNYPDVVIAYGTRNEPFVGPYRFDVVDYSEANRRAFANWLRARYGSIGALNAAWSRSDLGVSFGYPTFDAVQIPPLPVTASKLDPVELGGAGTSPEAVLDFHRFMRDEYTFGYLESRLRVIKSVAPRKATFVKVRPDVPEYGGAAINDAVSRLAESPYLDILGTDTYSVQLGYYDVKDPSAIRVTLSSIATAARRYQKKWAIFEMGVDIPEHVDRTLADLLRYTWSHGPSAVFLFKFINSENDPTVEFAEGYYNVDASTYKPEFQHINSSLTSPGIAAAPAADVAVLYAADSTAYRGPFAPVMTFKQALTDLGFRTTVLYDYEIRKYPRILARFKAVVAPRLALARTTPTDTFLLNALNEYVTNGGRAIIAGAFDSLSSNLKLVRSPGTPQVLPYLPNVALKPVDTTSPEYDQRIVFKAGFPWDGVPVGVDNTDTQLHLAALPGTNVIARYSRSGTPAIVSSNDGRVVVIGPSLRFSGDVNFDGSVDQADRNLIVSKLDSTLFDAKRSNPLADMNHDLWIRTDDLAIWDQDFCAAFCNTAAPYSLQAFLARIMDNWGIPRAVVTGGRGIVAHLAANGLAIGNNRDDLNYTTYTVVLPFATTMAGKLPADAFVTVTPRAANTVVTGTLLARTAVFVKLNVPVPIEGDLDGDGDIDSMDVAVITRAIGQPAAYGDARDVDFDGRITVLDARKLAVRCTRLNCATQ